MPKTKNLFHIVTSLLIALPLIIYWGYTNYISFNYPYEAYDPEYAYFLTSLAPFKGADYTYIDHPGTPVEILGTGFLALTYPFVSNGNPSDFIKYHLQDPRLFLLISHVFLLLCSLICAIYFYRIAVNEQKWDNVLVAISLALMFYAIHPYGFTSLRFWTHNSFNFFLGTGVLLFFYRIMQNKGEISRLNLVWLGLSCGLLTAVVLYLGAWVIGITTTIVLAYWAQKISLKKIVKTIITFWAACFAGFVVAILPILTKVPQFINWVISIITHQGIYGTGEEGIASPQMLTTNFLSLYQIVPTVFILVGVALLFFIATALQATKLFQQKPTLAALVIGLFVQMLVSLVIITKHPAEFYLLSITAVIPVLALTIKNLFFDQEPFLRNLFNGLLVVLTVIGLFNCLTTSIRLQEQKIQGIQTLNDKISELVRQRATATERKPRDIVLVWGQGVLTPCTLGRINSNYVRTFTRELASLCRNQYFTNDGLGQTPRAISLFKQSRPIEIPELKWDVIVVREANLSTFTPLFSQAVSIENLMELSPPISIIYLKD